MVSLNKPDDSKTEDVPRPSWKLCVGFGAAAVVGLLTGAVLGGVARSRENEQRGDAGSPVLYTEELESRGRAGDQMATAAYVFLALGAASAVVDIALWVERLRKVPRKKEASHAGLLRPTPSGVTVSPRFTGLEVSF